MPATTAAGPVLGVPGTILSIIAFCQTIQFSRNYEGDFALSSARLEIAGLRLLQWRQALENSEVQKAEPVLEKILQAFDNAKRKSQTYAKEHNIAEPGDAAQEQRNDASVVKKLRFHLAIRTRSDQYSNEASDKPVTASFMDKTRWIVYRKPHFDKLVADICEAIRELIELFPTEKARVQELCQRDLSGLESEQLELVNEVADDADDFELQEAIKVAMEAGGLVFASSEVSGRATYNMGNQHDRIATASELQSIRVVGSKFRGNSVSNFGHTIGISRDRPSATTVSQPDESSEASDSE